jgi:hypothetical protein
MLFEELNKLDNLYNGLIKDEIQKIKQNEKKFEEQTIMY